MASLGRFSPIFRGICFVEAVQLVCGNRMMNELACALLMVVLIMERSTHPSVLLYTVNTIARSDIVKGIYTCSEQESSLARMLQSLQKSSARFPSIKGHSKTARRLKRVGGEFAPNVSSLSFERKKKICI